MASFRKAGFVTGVLAAAAFLAMTPRPAAADQHSPAPVAEAAQASGFYYLLEFGLGDSENPDTDADFAVDLDWSMSLGFGVGYRLGPVRLEGEFSNQFYRVGSLDLGLASPFPDADYAGGMRSLSAMGNLYFDLPTAGRIRPYLGAGLGLARVSAEYNESVCFIYCFSTQNTVVDDWDKARAWQVMAGLSARAWSAKTEWFVGYRYYETEDLDFKTIDGTAFQQDGLQDHSIMGGFRFFM
jgi:opacity protein-like surface antigen